MGIQSKNREEWILVHIANMKSSVTTVAFYDTLGPQAVEFVIRQTELTTISCSSNYVTGLIKLKKEGKADSIENIVSFEAVSADVVESGRAAGLKVYTLQEVQEAGKNLENPPRLNEPTTDTISIFCYTSGTTGDPKAVKLSHKNIIAAQVGGFID